MMNAKFGGGGHRLHKAGFEFEHEKYIAAILLLVSLAVDSSKNPVLELIAVTSWKLAKQ